MYPGRNAPGQGVPGSGIPSGAEMHLKQECTRAGMYPGEMFRGRDGSEGDAPAGMAPDGEIHRDRIHPELQYPGSRNARRNGSTA